MPGKEWRNQIEMSDGVDVAHGLLPSAPTDRGIPRLVVAADGTRPESTGPHHAVAVPGQVQLLLPLLCSAKSRSGVDCAG